MVDLDEFAAKLRAVREEVAELERQCPHRLADRDFVRCDICGKDFGWRCPASPDHVCHYFTNELGSVTLLDGSTTPPPHGHDPEYETEDACIFCGQPEERK